MVPASRRDLLRFSTLALATGLGGCTSESKPLASTSTPSPTASRTEPPEAFGITTPSPGECEEQASPTPSATKELAPATYPSYPDEVTGDTAAAFAVAYEEAYWHNWVVRKDWMAGTDEVVFDGPSVPQEARMEHRNGFIIGVTGVLRTADVHTPSDQTPATETSTQVPYLDAPFSAWYYLTPDFALREQREGGMEFEQPEPDLSTAETIVCNRP